MNERTKFIIWMSCCLALLPNHLDAIIYFGTNSLADYDYERPRPGNSGKQIFDTLCSKAPPGCPTKHQGMRVAACAVSPKFDSQALSLLLSWKQERSNGKVVAQVDEIKWGVTDAQSKKKSFRQRGKVIVWDWDGVVQDELTQYLKSKVGDINEVDNRMKGFDLFIQGSLKHELYHVEHHFVPFFRAVENLYNKTNFKLWVPKVFEVKQGEPPPSDEVFKLIKSRLAKEVQKIEKTRDKQVNAFHRQQGEYQEDWLKCACGGDSFACKKMYPFYVEP